MSEENTMSGELQAWAYRSCQGLIGLYAASMLLPIIVPAFAGYAFPLQLALLSLFAFIHGAARYRPAGMLVFFAIMILVVNVLENISIGTGFPFGNFQHTDAVGPKIFAVPVATGFAYASSGYVAWVLASLLLNESDVDSDRLARIATPVVAMFIITGWDACIDPIGGTVARNWIWEDGGGYYGVPISNFFGWMLTTYIAYQLFAIYLSGRERSLRVGQSRGWWLLPCIQFFVMSLQYPLYWLTGTAFTVTDPAGQAWNSADIFEGTAVVSLFTMMFVSVTCLFIALRRSYRRH